MDNLPEGVNIESAPEAYDEIITYEEQEPPQPSLADRIGGTKVYLLSESSVARASKRKHAREEDDDIAEDNEMETDTSYRANAILFCGSPISHLPTARIFAYATHFDAHPMGLEWINDNTCILVFESKSAAQTALQHLLKSPAQDEDAEGFLIAKPIPIACWPPEQRINSSLGKGEGLKGVIRFRWARNDDVKQKGAKKQSQFYKKHGSTAGKELYVEAGSTPPKRRRRGVDDDASEKALLDDSLDTFWNEEPPSPPSKMRSDYISTSERAQTSLASRLMPRRRGGRQNGEGSGREGSRPKGRGRNGKVRSTQEELDAELDAFLNDKA